MNAGAGTDKGVATVPLLSAMFCVDCESISNSAHDVCTVCGSHSLISVFRMLGGTLRSQKAQPTAYQRKTAKYNLDITVKVHGVPGDELNHAIESISRLAEVCGDLESLHLNLESVPGTEGVLKVA